MEISIFEEKIKERLKKSKYYSEDNFRVKSNIGYKTVWMCKAAVIKIREQKTGTRLEIAKRFLKTFHLQKEAKFIKASHRWAKTPYTDAVIRKVLVGARAVFEECYKEGSVEIFGCCSKYIECSDRRKCVHSDIKIAEGCMYKLNLEEGRIFYGVNCNVRENSDVPKNAGKQGKQARLW